MSILYIVGTPIGNLGDMTLRSLDALRDADVAYPPDTQPIRQQLGRFGF